MSILISALNSRPAVASEIKPGDLWVTVDEDNADRDHVAHARRCDKNVSHRRDNTKTVVEYNHSSRAMAQDKPVLIWTGGSARPEPKQTGSGCKTLDDLLQF